MARARTRGSARLLPLYTELAARAYVVEHFNRHQQAPQFAALMERLAVKQRRETKGRLYCQSGKRLLDVTFTIPALVLLFPVLVLTALLVRLKLGSPILFRQVRPGLHGQPFTIYKFRTMTDACDAQGNLFPDAERLTPFGRFLRSTSLDELPELLNVLKGNMSLVGPRPLLMQYMGRYTPTQRRRHEVKPGITGWAQSNGRNTITWEEKFALDVWYVDHQSLWLDVKILFVTVWKVLSRYGISQEGHETMPNFMGTLKAGKSENERRERFGAAKDS